MALPTIAPATKPPTPAPTTQPTQRASAVVGTLALAAPRAAAAHRAVKVFFMRVSFRPRPPPSARKACHIGVAPESIWPPIEPPAGKLGNLSEFRLKADSC